MPLADRPLLKTTICRTGPCDQWDLGQLRCHCTLLVGNALLLGQQIICQYGVYFFEIPCMHVTSIIA